jgi:hypothetical protein
MDQTVNLLAPGNPPTQVIGAATIPGLPDDRYPGDLKWLAPLIQVDNRLYQLVSSVGMGTRAEATYVEVKPIVITAYASYSVVKLADGNVSIPLAPDDRYPSEDENGDFPYSNPDLCRACGKMILPENRRIADGCPCNSPRGVNHGLVPKNTCTCLECDPAQTGSTRYPSL